MYDSYTRIYDPLAEMYYSSTPYQPDSQKAVEGVFTYQFSHTNDWFAGSKKMKGVSSYNTRKHGTETRLMILPLLYEVSKLPEGSYQVVDGEIIR